MITNLKDITNPFEKMMTEKLLKYAISKYIFCPYSNKTLNYRNCIMIESDSQQQTLIIDGSYIDKVEELESAFKSKGIDDVKITINVKSNKKQKK